MALIGIPLLAGSLWAQSDPPGLSKGVDQGKKELGGIKKKIQEEKQRIRDISKKESSVITQLNTLDRNLIEKDKELKALKQKLARVDKKVQRANQDLGHLTLNIDAQEKLLLNRLVALYKFGDTETPQLLFSSGSYEDFLSLAAVSDLHPGTGSPADRRLPETQDGGRKLPAPARGG